MAIKGSKLIFNKKGEMIIKAMGNKDISVISEGYKVLDNKASI